MKRYLMTFNFLLLSVFTAAVTPLSGIAEPVQTSHPPQDAPSKSQIVTAKKRSAFSRNMVIASSVSLGAVLLTWNWLASSQQPAPPPQVMPPSATNVTSLPDDVYLTNGQISVAPTPSTPDQEHFVTNALDYAAWLTGAPEPLPVNERFNPADFVDVVSGHAPNTSSSSQKPSTLTPVTSARTDPEPKPSAYSNQIHHGFTQI
jgi:hypothetical protein